MTTKLDELKALMARFKAHPELNYPRIQLEVTLRNMAPALIAAVEALKLLHDNIAEYARINNLGGFDNQDMKMARAALAPFGENDEQKV